MANDQYRIERERVSRFNRARQKPRYLCHAPFTSMSVGMDGLVSPCCYTQMPDELTGNVYFPETGLQDIWSGKVFKAYRSLIKKRKLPASCDLCRDKLLREDFYSVKIREFDLLRPDRRFPSLIELAVDNTCNLECVMCSSLHSSRIASHFGVQTPRPDPDLLMDQLEKYLPHVQEMIFTGGEPFLSKFYRKVWEHLARVNPDCKITLNTNASYLDDEVKALLEKGRFNFNVSLDSVNKETYENIRINADFETVIRNFNYLCDYSRRHQVPISVPVCPLILNYRELPEIIGFCNDHQAYVVFVHVFGASGVALNAASAQILAGALEMLEPVRFPEDTPVSIHNARCFRELVEDIKSWQQQALKMESYIEKFIPETDSFEQAFTIYKEKIMADPVLGDKAALVILRMHEVFDLLPQVYRTSAFLAALGAFPVRTVADVLAGFPPVESAEYFRMVFRKMVSQ